MIIFSSPYDWQFFLRATKWKCNNIYTLYTTYIYLHPTYTTFILQTTTTHIEQFDGYNHKIIIVFKRNEKNKKNKYKKKPHTNKQKEEKWIRNTILIVWEKKETLFSALEKTL